MNKWQETVKRVAKQHPGKSLREILPLAKLEYKKMGHSSSASTKKHKKHHKKIHSHKRKHSRKGRKGRKGHKGRRGSRHMKGGEGDSMNSASSDPVPSPFNYEEHTDNLLVPDVKQSGGSHCGTHGRRQKRPKKPTRRRRRPRRRSMRGGTGCSSNSDSPASEPVAANDDSSDGNYSALE
tara:strand:- start:3942 stop:4481 length:540 start_codon:yes stop_codon:yes gene_type:complete